MKITKVSQQVEIPEPQAQDMAQQELDAAYDENIETEDVTPRQTGEVAKAIEKEAQAVGLRTSTYTVGSGEAASYHVICHGSKRSVTDGGPDIEIIYDLFPYGSMTTRIMRGMETGGNVDRIMREILARATENSGVSIMPQTCVIDPLRASALHPYSSMTPEQIKRMDPEFGMEETR